jgi:hypothetical protein
MLPREPAVPRSRTTAASLCAFLTIALAVASSIATSFYLHAQDANITSQSGTTAFVPGSFDGEEPSGAFIDYAPPPVPTYNLSSPRRTNVEDKEIQDRDPAARKLQQQETLGRVQTKDGSIGLETDRRGDPSKLVPFNDFSEGQSKKPDSFIGFSIVKPYDPK